MINLFSVFQATFVCFIFIISIVLSESYIKLQMNDPKHQNHQKFSITKIKITIMSLTVIFLMLYTYFNHCIFQIGPLQCFYINPSKQLVRDIAIAVFINTTLFLGGIHQQLYNGQIKSKFLRFYKREFQWDLFKKLFIVPLYIQIVFRGIFARIIDPTLEHPSFFTFLSGFIYGFSYLLDIFQFWDKYGFNFALKTVFIQVFYNLLFGMYVSHIFSKSRSLMSALVLQVYANFMGFPYFIEILKGGQSADDRVKKSTIFYIFGVIGCFTCCLFL